MLALTVKAHGGTVTALYRLLIRLAEREVSAGPGSSENG